MFNDYQSYDAVEGWRTYGNTCKVSVPPCWYCFLPYITSRDTGYTASTLKTYGIIQCYVYYVMCDVYLIVRPLV